MTEQFSTALAEKILSEIQASSHILMHCHPSPDADSMGSVLGMKFALETLGKKVTIIKGDSIKPQYLTALPGYADILEQNFFETDLSQFDLFLILDAAAPGQISRKAPVVFPENLKTIIIDHHKTNTGFAQINLIDDSYSSTAHIVYDLLEAWKIPISHESALNIFAGMYTDTGGFKYRSTTYKTLAVAAKLAEIAPDFTELLFSMDNSNTKERLLLEGALLSSVETYFNDSVAIASVSHDYFTSHGIDEDAVSGIDVANALKSVIGWNIGISMMEKEEGIVRISMRSRDAAHFDVSKVAVLIGGGGHAAAAGAAIHENVPKAKEILLEALAKALPNLKTP